MKDYDVYSDRHYYTLANVHIRSQTPVFYTSQRHRNDIAKQQQQTAAATSSTEIRLSYVVINIIINEMKTKAAFKAANEHLLAATTLVVINTIYLCVAI
jgi:hypothetical protein